MFASFDVRRMIEDSFKPVEIKEAEEVEELEEVEERSPSSRLTSAWPLPPRPFGDQYQTKGLKTALLEHECVSC